MALAAAALVALVYAVAVPLEAAAWRDELALWRHAVDVEPDAALAQSNLGITLLRAHVPAEALVHLEAAERLSGGGASTSMQLALALDELGRYDEAVAAAQKSLAADDTPAGRAILARIIAARDRP